MKVVILCGGSGTRLWPLSRTLFPKQFYPLRRGLSLYQETLQRNAGMAEEFIVVVNQEQFFMAQDQLTAMKLNKPARFILEPVGRNTAPAIALAALSCHEEDTMLVVPSDHLIEDQHAYQTATRQAVNLAKQDRLVTFGLTPRYPETGYGYIEASGDKVISFKEKPDQATAERYISSGKFFWNSGMFCFKARALLQEMNVHCHDMLIACRQSTEDFKTSPVRISKDRMLAIPSDSIDYAVMEKSKNCGVICCDIGWSDLGSFDALYEALPKDSNANTIDSNLINIDSKNNLIISGKRLITTIGIEGIVVVDTPDALLLAKRGSTQKVKEIVGELKHKRPELTEVHITAYRPWGSYTVLEETPHFKVKRIVVNPGARLSLQKHHKRSEHWVIVQGRAKVTVGEKVFYLERNQSTYIPIGEIHRLENEEQEDLVMIESQVGDYLGEDDIIRIQDDYKR